MHAAVFGHSLLSVDVDVSVFVVKYLGTKGDSAGSVREYVFFVFFRFPKNMTFYVFLK